VVPYAQLAEKVGGITRLAEALQVDRGTITRAAEGQRWLTGAPAVRLHALCIAYQITVPEGMKPDWV
jgi:hypothetical protein